MEPCTPPQPAWSQRSFAPYTGEAGGRVETVTVRSEPVGAAGTRYELHTTQAQRDGKPQSRRIEEAADGPRLRCGDLLFDALFAMSVDDARLNSVGEIRDPAYHDGRPVALEVFQTGEAWPYVWTRDLAYAVHLGLAWLDPQRAQRSLLFKTSGFRPGAVPPAPLPPDSVQIVQDTGSGGSWPVSTDRVSWAWGAQALLAALTGDEHRRFSAQALQALRGTIEADREVAFDARCGLYGGEQSFLDWRTQSYAPWITDDLTRMATSKSLSTNVGHCQALRLAAHLASQHGMADLSGRYAAWADALALAIDRMFWLPDVQQYASMTTHDNVALHTFDLLGTSLAILAGVASPQRGREALARYPMAPFGAPVIAPQQPDVPVYHNRAIWPFVTGYAVRAAALVDNPALVQAGIESLMRAAALHLSNMENVEWLTGKSLHDDGPVINSRRQLWSVGAYVGMVVETVFGLHPGARGLRVRPYLTTATRRMFGDTPRAQLLGLQYQMRPITVTLHLPDCAPGEGRHVVSAVTLNGQPAGEWIDPARWDAASNHIEVRFGRIERGDARVNRIPKVQSSSRDDPRVFAPPVPTLNALRRDADRVELQWSMKAPCEVRFNVYRNGSPTARELSGSSWTQTEPCRVDLRTRYSVEAVSAFGHHSQHSAPACDDDAAAIFIAVTDERLVTAHRVPQMAADLPRPGLMDWELPQDRLTVRAVSIDRAGRYAISITYDNHEHTIESGITAAVKRLRVRRDDGTEIAHGVLQMPHVDPREDRHPLRQSTELEVTLTGGCYVLEFSDFFNMSYLTANEGYRHSGGVAGMVNRITMAGVRIVRLA